MSMTTNSTVFVATTGETYEGETVVGVRLTFDAAAEQGKTETRQYIKRQETWLRKHMAGWEWK